MSKLILAAIAVVIIGGGAYYMWGGSAGESMEGARHDDAMMQDEQAGAFSGSFMDLAKRGGEWKCTFDSTTVVGKSSGTVYVSGEKIRGDFAIEAPYVGATEIHMVSDGAYTYTWGPLMPQGVKAKVVTEAKADATTAPQGQMFDANVALTYDCNPAQHDAGLFVPPADVTFTSIN